MTPTGKRPPELDAVANAYHDELEARQRIRTAIYEARMAGFSWDAIASVMGVSRQNTAKRFQSYVDERNEANKLPCSGSMTGVHTFLSKEDLTKFHIAMERNRPTPSVWCPVCEEEVETFRTDAGCFVSVHTSPYTQSVDPPVQVS